MNIIKLSCVLGLLLVANTLQAQFQFWTNSDGSLRLTGYSGSDGTVVIPNSVNGHRVATVDSWAFYGCYSLTNVIIPEGVSSIGASAFGGCTNLISVTIPNGVTSIGTWTFEGCSRLTKIAIPEGVTSIGDWAFEGCEALTSVKIPNSVTSIGDGAFEGCSSLTKIEIPQSVTSIGDWAFEGCSSLTKVVIPQSVTSIGDWAFEGCYRLTKVTLPAGVTSIGDWAFGSCSLTHVTIPGSVTNIGNQAFAYCTLLTNITVDSHNKNYASLGGVLFNKSLTALIEYPCGKTNSTYTIPNSVTRIDGSAFEYCSKLYSVTIPDNVTNIGDQCFADCNRLAYIGVGPRNATYASIDGVLFDKTRTTLIRYPIGRPAASYAIPSGVTNIAPYAFEGCRLERITIPSSVTEIGDNAFNACMMATDITIPNTVTTIGSYAFGNCWNLTRVRIPSSVGIIGDDAFGNCSRLTTITIPSSVTNISDFAFEDCRDLTSAFFEGDVPASFGRYVFNWCSPQFILYYPAIANGWSTPTWQGYNAMPYSFTPVGSLKVSILPKAAISAGAKWRVDGGAWQSSGATLSAISAGTHVVSFAAANRFSTPADQIVTITANQTAPVTTTYANPFVTVAGTYQGLFYVPGNITPDTAGMFTVSITSNGTYTVQILLAGQTHSASGLLPISGAIMENAVSFYSTHVHKSLRVDMTNGTVITGFIGNEWVASATAYRIGKSNIGGKYTLVIPGSDDSTASPGGDGIGSLVVSSTGKATLNGTLADGTVISSSAGISEQGQWPLYASLYSGKGLILGWLTFTNSPDTDLDGQVYWVKQAHAAKYYPRGFTNQAEIVGSAYVLTNGQMFPSDFGKIEFSEGNLPAGFSVPMSLVKNDIASTNKTLSVTLDTTNGLMSGSVANPNGGKPTTLKFKGAVLQKQNTACGYFLGTNQSGRIVLEP